MSLYGMPSSRPAHLGSPAHAARHAFAQVTDSERDPAYLLGLTWPLPGPVLQGQDLLASKSPKTNSKGTPGPRPGLGIQSHSVLLVYLACSLAGGSPAVSDSPPCV